MILILTSSSEKARLSEDGWVFSTRFPAEDLSFYFLLLISQPALLLRHAVRLTLSTTTTTVANYDLQEASHLYVFSLFC